jgi:hypothetical protein
MYDIIYDKKSIDFLNGLDKKRKTRIFKKITLAKEKPFRYFVT